MLCLKVGRDRPLPAFAIAAVERLPSKVILGNREIAGQFAHAFPQNLDNISTTIGGKLVILRRRNAQTKERGPLPRHPPHDPPVKKRANATIKETLLIFHRLRL